MKSNKKHYHLSLYSLHKFPLSPEKWGQIATMVSDPLWKKYIKYIIKSKPSSVREIEVNEYSSIIHYSHQSPGQRLLAQSFEGKSWTYSCFSTHIPKEREKAPKHCTAALAGMSLCERHAKLTCSSLWFSNISKADGHSFMCKLVKLGKACFLNCK